MDHLFDFKDKTLLLKIDTEGHETSVLKGGRNVLRNNTCFVQLELGHGKRDASEENIFDELGYRKVFAIGPDCYYSNSSKYSDPVISLELLERALNNVINARWKKSFDFV